MYTRGLEDVEARVLACIGVEEGMQAIVSVVGRVEEVFLAVEVARAGSERSRVSGRRLVGSACT
jgi:hypothetical protein